MQPHSFDHQPVHLEDVPFWMRSIDDTMGRLQDLIIRTSPEDPPPIYTLRCASKTSTHSTLLERLAASLEAHDYLELPDELPIPCQPNPGDFETRGQFLNAVAAQLNLAKLGLQFHTVHLLLEDDFKTQLHPNTGYRKWPEIQELIASEPYAEFEFEYTLRPLGHDEISLLESQTATLDMVTRICAMEREKEQRMEGFIGALLADMSDGSKVDDKACGGDQGEVD
ncbi:hypothetical protein IWX90DRAFT_232780 [Phyllosticta citrichinensis]|uniref:Uncharacterized protein n=1 Tax=Phyllosticta citrichinensis TaxID=1130410 RepID=A0ABR1XV49_9PEZI